MVSHVLAERPAPPAVLRKAVAAISMVPTKGKITLLGRQSWNVLLQLAQAQSGEQEREIFRSPLSDLVKGIDFNSKNIEIVKTHLRSMLATTVEWQSPTAGEGMRWDAASMLAHAALYRQRGESWIEWSYAANVRPELLNPQVFVKLNLEVISRLRTISGLALYEACARYKEVGQTGRKPWRWWAPVLLGRADDERMHRLEYRIFKRDTLRPALAEINSASDLKIEMIEHKAGRFVADLQFAVAEKRKHTVQPSAPPARLSPVDLGLVARARELDIEQDKFERLLEDHGQEAVSECLLLVERRVASNFPGPLRDTLRYLKSLLLNAPEPATPSSMPQSATDAKVDSPRTLASAVGAADPAAEQRARRIEELVAEIEALPAAEQDQLETLLLEELEASNRHPATVRRLRQNGWRHPYSRHEMVSFYGKRSYGENWEQSTASSSRATPAPVQAKLI